MLDRTSLRLIQKCAERMMLIADLASVDVLMYSVVMQSVRGMSRDGGR